MITKQRMTLLAALMASVGLVTAGCGDRSAERVGGSSACYGRAKAIEFS